MNTAQINLRETTFVTGYWHVANNAKRDPAHYSKLLPETLKLIEGGKLIVVHDDKDFFSHCTALAEQFNITIAGMRAAISDLPYFNLSADLLNSCKSIEPGTLQRDRGAMHYNREYLKSGEKAYRELSTIWMSKISLITRLALQHNVFDTERFSWIDVSISRFNYKRENWNFVKNSYTDAGVIYHYPNKARYMNQTLTMNGSFIYAFSASWRKLDKLFDEFLMLHKSDCYAHDDETILNFIVRDHPEFFRNCAADNPIWRKVVRKVNFIVPRVLQIKPIEPIM